MTYKRRLIKHDPNEKKTLELFVEVRIKKRTLVREREKLMERSRVEDETYTIRAIFIMEHILRSIYEVVYGSQDCILYEY